MMMQAICVIIYEIKSERFEAFMMKTGHRPITTVPATSHAAQSNKSDDELRQMARKAWLEKGVLVVDVSTVFKPEESDVLKRVGNRMYGVRSTLIKG